MYLPWYLLIIYYYLIYISIYRKHTDLLVKKIQFVKHQDLWFNYSYVLNVRLLKCLLTSIASVVR